MFDLLGFDVRDQKEGVAEAKGGQRTRKERKEGDEQGAKRGKSTAQQRASVMCVSSVSRV